MLKNNKKHLISNLLTKDILEDLDKSPQKKIDDDTWEKLNNSVLFKSFNNYKSGSKLLSFDLDDTIISFEKKKSGKSKSPQKESEDSYIFSFGLNKIKEKLDDYQKKIIFLQYFQIKMV